MSKNTKTKDLNIALHFIYISVSQHAALHQLFSGYFSTVVLQQMTPDIFLLKQIDGDLLVV